MTIQNEIGFKVLRPSEGMWLYDGVTFSDSVYMPLNADERKWQEVTDDFKVAEEARILAGMESMDDENEIYTDTVEQAKQTKLAEIDAYDSSSAVNGFIYNGNEFWLDKATRVGLVNSTNMLKQIGEETTTLWLDSFCVTLPCDKALQMLCAIEVYALKCYNKTAEHKANVKNLLTLEDVENYDYTIGYPEKLMFNAE